jgi:hypothetical protein
MRFLEKLKKWYEGVYVPPPPNDPHSYIQFVSPGDYDRPWLARAIDAVCIFFKNHWQWATTTILAVIAIVVSIK